MIQHTYDTNDASNYSTNRSEERNPAFLIGLGNLNMKRRHLVKEKDARKYVTRQKVVSGEKSQSLSKKTAAEAPTLYLNPGSHDEDVL